MAENNIQETPESSPQSLRPKMLTIVCILSFIGSGLVGLSHFMIYSTFNDIMPALAEASKQLPGIEWLLSAKRNFYLAGFVFYFVSFFGVSLMWRMRKSGFHFYTGSQIVILLMPVFYIHGYPIPFFDGVITLLFIMTYAKFYRLFT